MLTRCFTLRKRNETYLPLPSQPQLVLIYRTFTNIIMTLFSTSANKVTRILGNVQTRLTYRYTGKSIWHTYYVTSLVNVFPSLLWHCWLGDRKGIRPVKNWMLVCWWWWLELCMTYSSSSPVGTTTSIIVCVNKHQLSQVHLENGR